MVLMHGKWASPQSLYFVAKRYEEGCAVKLLEMPWSGRRDYDVPYPDALNEIERQVKEFRVQGYKRILLAGHSFGANAGFAYASSVREKIDSVIALAPGHAPNVMYANGMSRQAVDSAKELINANKKDEKLGFDDMNQGRRKSVRMTAETLFSYFDPIGLGNMRLTASNYKESIPTLIVVGTDDVAFPVLRSAVFERLPSHPMNVYLEINANHGNTPEQSVQQVIAWLNQVSQSP